MLIGAGIIFVFALLFGGTQNDLFISNINKYAEKEIVDKERRNQIKVDSKAADKLNKEYQKRTKKYTKNLAILIPANLWKHIAKELNKI